MATLQNIGKLKYRGKDGQWHPLPVVVQDADGGVSTISGKGAPTPATQGKVNQLYRDEDTQRLYICTATDGGYTWAAVSGGSVDVDATLTKAGYAADAKAVGDAIQNATDKDAVRFVEQELTDTQKQQARENIGTIPKLFWKPWEEIAKSTVIDDSGSIGYKSITLPVHIKNKDNITYTYDYIIHLRRGQPDTLEYTDAFDLYELEDGNLYVKADGKYFNIFIIEKTKIFDGVWNITLQITKKSETPTEGMVLNSKIEIDFPIRLIGKYVPRTRYAKARTRNSKDLFLDNNGIGFVDPEISVVRNQNELRDELLSSAKTIICNYEDSVTDVFWIKSVENPAGGYLVNQGLGIKNGKIGTVDIVIDQSSANYFSGTFTPSNVVIPQPPTAQPGQIVRVKAVDESGKITETETVDMPNRLDVIVSMGDNGWVVSHKFAEVTAAYVAGRAVQLINVSNSSILYSLEYISTDNNGVSSANFRYIDIGGDIWQAEINSNDEIEFFQGSTFLALYGDIPQDTPKAITYSVANGIGYADVMLREDTALILKSSTEGSTKKFKITVDDSGTMSATEITN